MLYNYKDTPHDLFGRVRDLLGWGVSAYPMRYQPLSGRAWRIICPNLSTSHKLYKGILENWDRLYAQFGAARFDEVQVIQTTLAIL